MATESPASPVRSDRTAPQLGPRTALATFVGSASLEVLAVTYWFDPAPSRTTGAIVVRFWGHRQGAGAKTQPGDQFVHDQKIDGLLPDSGIVSVTARIGRINAGSWIVSAKVIAPEQSAPVRRGRSSAAVPALALQCGNWSWGTWSLRQTEPRPLKTSFAPFAQVPGVLPLVWAGMVGLGLIAALAIQQAVLQRLGLHLPQTLVVSLGSVAAGTVGAKIRFISVHRHDGRFEGWSIQGFLGAITIIAPVALALANVPIGVLLDASTPGLFVGLAIGRVGCFLAGCCAGRPTSSPWGIWSSDQRLGMRRVPTQLLESGLSLAIAIVTLVAVLGGRALVGGVFIGALALYTLVRQGILRLRVERPKAIGGGTLIALGAAVVLIADIALIALAA